MQIRAGKMPTVIEMALGLAGGQGILGTEVLEHGVFRLSESPIELAGGSPIEMVQGVPLVSVEIAGQPVPMFLDTGAPLSYLSAELVRDRVALGEQEDFHPLVGRFLASTYAVALRAMGQAMQIRAGRMPTVIETALALGGAEGILGTEVLEHGVVRWSARQRRMALVAY